MTAKQTAPSPNNFRRGSQAYKRLRDHAAYAWATGRHPTHLRESSKAVLRAIATDPGHRIPQGWAEHLKLDEHAMVVEVRARQAAGWTAVIEPHFRNGHGVVRMRRGHEKIAVLINGSVQSHWDGPSRR